MNEHQPALAPLLHRYRYDEIWEWGVCSGEKIHSTPHNTPLITDIRRYRGVFIVNTGDLITPLLAPNNGHQPVIIKGKRHSNWWCWWWTNSFFTRQITQRRPDPATPGTNVKIRFVLLVLVGVGVQFQYVVKGKRILACAFDIHWIYAPWIWHAPYPYHSDGRIIKSSCCLYSSLWNLIFHVPL